MSSWGGLFRSTDGAASWTRRSAPSYLWDVALDPEAPQTVYAIAGSGVYHTRDGASWRGFLSAVGVPCPVACPLLHLVAVSPSSPHVIYAVSGPGGQVRLWSSRDGGETWTRGGKIGVTAGGDEPAALLVDPTKASTVYVWVSGRGVFRSADGGARWARASGGLPVGRLSSLAADPARSGVLYAAARTVASSGARTRAGAGPLRRGASTVRSPRSPSAPFTPAPRQPLGRAASRSAAVRSIAASTVA
jgi:hypothetical protein